MSGVLGLTACANKPAAPPPLPPTKIAVTFNAQADLNPDGRRRPSPLVLRVYELKGTAAFDAADYLSLNDRDQATLGAELLGRDELIIRPGEVRRWDKAPHADTRFLGVFGAYRDLDNARWKAAVALVPNRDNVIDFTLASLSMSFRRISP